MNGLSIMAVIFGITTGGKMGIYGTRTRCLALLKGWKKRKRMRRKMERTKKKEINFTDDEKRMRKSISECRSIIFLTLLHNGRRQRCFIIDMGFGIAMNDMNCDRAHWSVRTENR